MGYWEQSEDGLSFSGSASGEELLWGDTPADIIDNALWEIKAAFLKDVGRLPSVAEIIAGIKFSTNVLEGLPEVPSVAKQVTAQQEAVLEQHYYPATRGDEPTPPRVLEGRRHIEAVMQALTTEPVVVPDNAADLDPF